MKVVKSLLDGSIRLTGPHFAFALKKASDGA
jgi:hypothetical protein